MLVLVFCGGMKDDLCVCVAVAYDMVEILEEQAVMSLGCLRTSEGMRPK